MPEQLTPEELQNIPVVDFYPETVFDYNFRHSGDLEFVDVRGQWRRIRGCSADPDAGIHAFNENIQELDYLIELFMDSLPTSTPLEQFYHSGDARFRYLIDECLDLNYIERRWFSPRMIGWMFFDRIEGGHQVTAALRVLNRLAEPKYSAGKGKPINSRAEWMAMVATHCGGDLGKARALAKATGARDLMAELDALGYFSLDTKAQHKRDVELWAAGMRAGKGQTEAAGPFPTAEQVVQAAAVAAAQEQGGSAAPTSPQELPRPRARAMPPAEANPPSEDSSKGKGRGGKAKQ